MFSSVLLIASFSFATIAGGTPTDLVDGIVDAVFTSEFTVKFPSALSQAPETAAPAFVIYRAGSLVFGGGHVVLPLLQTEVVGPGWVTNEQFVAGYGAAQAVPGPLFTFSVLFVGVP